jgi:hypothetical protein
MLSPASRTLPSADTALVTEPVPPATAFSFACRAVRSDFRTVTGVLSGPLATLARLVSLAARLSASEVSRPAVAVDNFTCVSVDTAACTAATSAQTAELACEPLAVAAVDEDDAEPEEVAEGEPDEPGESADGVLEVHPAASSMTAAVLTLSAAAFHGTKLVIIKLRFPSYRTAAHATSRALTQVSRPAPKSPLHSYRIRPMYRCGARRHRSGPRTCRARSE